MEQSWAAAHSRSKPQAGQAPQRIFFGLWPSAATAEQTMAWAHDAHALCGGRVMRPETLQVTLAFLGSTPAARVAELVRAEPGWRSEEQTSELQSLMCNSYAVFCLKKKKTRQKSKYYAVA